MCAAPRHLEPLASFADSFAKARPASPEGLSAQRDYAFARFQRTGIPTPRVEAWKFTNVAKHANVPMILAPSVPVASDDLAGYFAGGPLARRLVFVNSHHCDLSHARGLPEGVRMDRLEVRVGEPAIQDWLTKLDDGRSFSDLNMALMQSGAVIEVPAGVKLEAPLQLLFLSVGQGAALMSHPRILIRLGEGAEAHIVESHIGIRDGHCLSNLVSQIEIGEGARLIHDRLQMLKDGATFIGKADIEVGSDGRLQQTLVSLGGSLIRNESEVRLNGTQIDAEMHGVCMPTAREHVDNMIRMHHLKPDCRSNQFYKGIMDGRGRGVFAGKIIVHEDAQRTNAFQTNNNLLLSDDAEVDSKPELEIYADDVKCSHGATCGDHDMASVFYLRSRGIDRATAESILTYAFAGEIVEKFADADLRRQAKEAIFRRLPGGDNLTEML